MILKRGKTYTIREFDSFVSEEKTSGMILPEKFFRLPQENLEILIRFVKENNQVKGKAEAVDLLTLSYKSGLGDIVTAKNYVGIITMKDSTVIEILPKIASADKSANEDTTKKNNWIKTKKIFIEMLKTVKDLPSKKEFSVSSLQTEKLSIFEVFIKMFIDEVIILTRQGLKSAYNAVESNERFYKGKLLVVENIRYNSAREERFYVRYDEYHANCPENRLIKTTLKYLQSYSQNHENQRNIVMELSKFDGTEESINIDADFSKCGDDRTFARYQKLIAWCKVFLKGRSFTAFAGSKIGMALLYPMEKLFENYIAELVKRYSDDTTEVIVQGRGGNTRYLFDDPDKFMMRPDIIVKDQSSKCVKLIMDTKWKMLENNPKENYGISQDDMYQMYAYAKKYDTQKIVLIYPQTENVLPDNITYRASDGIPLEVKIMLLNLNDIKSVPAQLLKLLQ